MMRKLFPLLFVITFSSSIAQNFDSLIVVSLKMESDTEKVNLFYTEGFKARLFSPQFAYDCAKQAEYFGTQSKSQKHLAKAYNLIGVLYYRKGDFKKAMDFHLKALELREQINDENGIALSETNLGNIYVDLQKIELAEASYLRALQIHNKLGNEKQTGNCYINIGILKIGTNNLEEAEKYFLSAYKIAKILMDYELEALCLNNLAVVNTKTNNFEASIGNSLDALKIRDMIGNEMDKTDSYINLAEAFFKTGNQKEYEYYLNKADSLCNLFDYLEAKCELRKLQTEIYEASKQFDLAYLSLKQYVAIKDSIALENKQLLAQNNFSEERAEEDLNQHIFKFPYLMLILLLSLSIGVLYFIYRNKR